MKIVQLLPTVAYGDAVGNNALAIAAMLRRQGCETAIYAENIDARLPRGLVQYASEMPALSAQDVLLYHLSFATELNLRLTELGGRKVIQYHNITPARYFEPYDAAAAESCRKGREQMCMLRDVPQLCLADSEYNRQELLAAGYACPVKVCPILVPFADYAQTPDSEIIERYRDGWANFLFVGRVTPNKKQEDVIRAFAWYKRHISEKARLFLVGSEAIPRYTASLDAYVHELGVKDVIFPGHIRFSQILAYYHAADVFLCMSEHEGFCVPLLEAMYFGVPIVARNTTAIPGTLGGSGLLLPDADPVAAALAAERILRSPELKTRLAAGQKMRLRAFSEQAVQEQLLSALRGL